jgi:hypothetical protein
VLEVVGNDDLGVRITIEVDTIGFKLEDIAHDLRLLLVALVDVTFRLFKRARLDIDQFMFNLLDSVITQLVVQEVLE